MGWRPAVCVGHCWAIDRVRISHKHPLYKRPPQSCSPDRIHSLRTAGDTQSQTKLTRWLGAVVENWGKSARSAIGLLVGVLLETEAGSRIEEIMLGEYGPETPPNQRISVGEARHLVHAMRALRRGQHSALARVTIAGGRHCIMESDRTPDEPMDAEGWCERNGNGCYS